MPFLGMGFVRFASDGALTFGGTTPANQPPATPTVTAGTLTSSGATLTGSAFSDPDVGDTHAASQWQVTTSADTGYAAPVISTGDDATNKTSYAATGLSASTDYIARVRYKDSAGNYSSWATSASFTTAAGSTFDFGINLRNTAAFVTDGANDSYSIGVVYPETRKSVTFGWQNGRTASLNPVDRSAALDPRLAGMCYIANNTLKDALRIDLPSAGTYTLTIAAGDSANPAGRQYIEVLDDATSLYIIDVASVASGSFIDANGTAWTSANWPANNTKKTGLVFASTICWIRIGANDGGAGLTELVHVHLLRTA